MPTLTYTLDQSTRAALLNSRVLIGRRLSHGISLTDRSVSRLHAWIDPVADENAQWVVNDAGSKIGTFVNDQKITRHPLHDGDRIRVGKLVLTYHDSDQLCAGAEPVEVASPTGTVFETGTGAGILFECACGAPLWVGSELAGKRGMCRHCRMPVTVPAASTPTTTLKPSKSKRPMKCAVCHSAITDGEETVECADCAMTFHTECWHENLGCSSYGCPQVDALKPPDESHAMTPAPDESNAELVTPGHRWDLILLAASVVASVVGALTFGGLAAIVAIAGIVILIQGKQPRPVFWSWRFCFPSVESRWV